jgi:C1A family cysteine protease
MAYESADPQALRAAIQREGARWEPGPTALSELPPAERQRRLGYVPGPDEPPLAAREAMARANLEGLRAWAAAVGAPPAFDLRNVGGQNYITPIKDQGGCGSCVAFGTVAAIEGTQRFAARNPALNVDYSEAQLFYCHARNLGRTCANGWWVDPAMDAVKNTGLADEACYPYVANDQNCTNLCADWQSRKITLSGWHRVTAPADMKEWLWTRGPMAACLTVYDDFFSYRSGIYSHVTGSQAGGHCVCIVGYNDTEKYWVGKNSWGTGWGENGFFRIAYGQVGIDAVMWAVDGVVSAGGGWQRDKLVRGLWASDAERNAWAYVDTLGWRRIAPDNDPIFVTMLTQLSTAKLGNRQVDILEENNVIKQVYVK